MKFQEFNKAIKQQFAFMCEQPVLFRSKISGHEVWDKYISSFTKEADPVFRDPNSTEHTCNHDKNFIHRYGNIVALVNGEIVTMFDTVDLSDNIYSRPANNVAFLLKNNPIENVFVESYDTLNRLLNYESTNKTQAEYKLGFEKSNKIYTQEEADKFGVVTPGQVYTFYHFNAILPKKFVDFSSNSVESIQGNHRDAKNVFKRGLDEISLDTLVLVRDLIQQGSLLNGDSYLDKLKKFIEFATEYKDVPTKEKDNWCWIKSNNLPFAKFRNELIGTLCVELTQGEDLNKAVLTWNKRVDPANYMKATAPISQKQIAEAKKFVEENGYEESFDRRFSTLDDINISEILHQNVGTDTIKQASVFDKVAPSTSTQHKRSQFDGIEEVSIEKFMKDILPTCASIEAFLENRFSGNLVALHTANNPDSKKAFKWSNNFGWTYNGNLAGKSMIKDAVKDRGGKIEAPIRVSIHFPKTTSDYDLHCKEPNGNEIYYSNRRSMQPSSGMLDLDAQGCDGHFPPEKRVENLTYSNLSVMPNGEYRLFVHNYSGPTVRTDFTAEVEILGEITSLFVKASHKGTVELGKLLCKNGQVEFIPDLNNCQILESQSASTKIWNLDTNQFHKVNLVCLSPNFWGDNNTGNKHYMFMLDNCKSDIALRSFHTEFLNSDLLEHRKVMEVLGETTKLEPATKQLCGLGFNSTISEELILKLSGSHKRTIKIKF